MNNETPPHRELRDEPTPVITGTVRLAATPATPLPLPAGMANATPEQILDFYDRATLYSASHVEAMIVAEVTRNRLIANATPRRDLFASPESAPPQLQQEAASPQLQQESAPPQLQQEAASPQLQQEAAPPQLQQEAAPPQLQQESAPQLQQEAAPPQLQQESEAEPSTSPQARVVTPDQTFLLDSWTVHDQLQFDGMFAGFMRSLNEIASSDVEASWKLFFRFLAHIIVQYEQYYDTFFAEDPLPAAAGEILGCLGNTGWLTEPELTGEGLKTFIKTKYIAVLFKTGKPVMFRELATDKTLVQLHDVTIGTKLGDLDICFKDGHSMETTIDRIEPCSV